MDWKYFVPIISLVSVIAGWLLNEFSYYFRRRLEDKRVLKNVLFNLLEVWHIMKADNPDLAVETMLNILSKRFPDVFENKSVLDSWKPFYRDFAEDLARQITTEEVSSVKQKYNASIDALTKVDPLLAYKLSGKLFVHRYLELLNNRVSELKIGIFNIPANENIADGPVKYLRQIVEPMILDEEIETLEGEILEVARRISLITYIKTNRKLKKHNAYILREISMKMDRFLEGFEEMVKSESGEEKESK